MTMNAPDIKIGDVEVEFSKAAELSFKQTRVLVFCDLGNAKAAGGATTTAATHGYCRDGDYGYHDHEYGDDC